MKLIAKYNRVNLVTTVIVMLLTGLIYYQAISLILTNQVDKDLKVEEQEIREYVELNHQLPQVFESKDQQIKFTDAGADKVERKFISTDYYKKKRNGESEIEVGRGLVTSVMVNHTNYKVLIVESTVETEDLIKIIFFITLAVILLLLLVLFVANRLILSRIWQPFYAILKQMKLFNLSEKSSVSQYDSNIDEFKELNQAVLTMTSRVKTEYDDLKVFTENASHELLTPIAVINSKLDSLIQTENFTERQSALLNDLYNSVSRVTRLNQSMLLLARIENKLIIDKDKVNLKELITEKLSQFQELFQDKRLVVHTDMADKELEVSKYLMEILLNNLLFNAIRHNDEGGSVNIVLNAGCLSIQNTGSDEDLSTKDIFKRFNKSAGSAGSGLGLTISKQICQNNGFELTYSYMPPLHGFSVWF